MPLIISSCLVGPISLFTIYYLFVLIFFMYYKNLFQNLLLDCHIDEYCPSFTLNQYTFNFRFKLCRYRNVFTG